MGLDFSFGRMALHQRSLNLGVELLRLLDDQIKDQQKWHEGETAAATKLQTKFRESQARHKFHVKKKNVAKLQRVYRGSVGRVLTAAERARQKVIKQGLLYAYFAEIMQKVWRGFYSRRNKHDYHARKKYIQRVIDTSDELQRKIQEYADEVKRNEVKAKVEKRKQDFKNKSARLHYLTSTKVQRGVFNGPYSRQPEVDGVPVEKAIKQNVTEYLRKNKLNKHNSVLKPFPRRSPQTIRASDKYDDAQEIQRKERRYEKLRRGGRGDFLAGTRVPAPRYKRGFQEGCEYIEPRILKMTSKEIMDKQKHKRVSTKHFALATRSGSLFD